MRGKGERAKGYCEERKEKQLPSVVKPVWRGFSVREERGRVIINHSVTSQIGGKIPLFDLQYPYKQIPMQQHAITPTTATTVRMIGRACLIFALISCCTTNVGGRNGERK